MTTTLIIVIAVVWVVAGIAAFAISEFEQWGRLTAGDALLCIVFGGAFGFFVAIAMLMRWATSAADNVIIVRKEDGKLKWFGK